jgi:hypothetical protein
MKEKERKEIMTWMKNLKFPDGFAVSFRMVVNLKTGKLTGQKSHDYHVIMEWLLPNMLRGYVHQDVWRTLVELSYFYRQLYAKEIKKEMMDKLEKEILVLLCKLEKIFSPGGLIQCNIYLFIFHMKLRQVAWCNIGGCILLKEL